MAQKKRVLDDFRITAIAAVDRPCQLGAVATIRKSADEVPTKKKAHTLRDIVLSELSLCERGANVDALICITKKRDEPAPVNLGNPAARAVALAAMERAIDRVQKAAAGPEATTLAEALAKACPTPRNAALDALEDLVAKRMDATGFSSVDCWDHFAKVEPDLYKRAIDGGDV